MKFLYLFIFVISFAFLSCEPSVDFNLLGSESGSNTTLTRKIIVQTEDGSPCSNARAICEYGNYQERIADELGQIYVSYKALNDSSAVAKNFTVFKDSTDTDRWQGEIHLISYPSYKSFYVSFPND